MTRRDRTKLRWAWLVLGLLELGILIGSAVGHHWVTVVSMALLLASSVLGYRSAG